MFLSTWEWIRLLGFLSYFYFTLSIVFGLLRKSPVIKSHNNLYFQLHQFSGWLGFFALVAHMILLIIDQYEPYKMIEILVPFSANYRPVLSALGSIALYLFLLVFFTSDFLMKKMGFSRWKKVHLLVFPAWILSLFHGLFIGTDSKNTFILLFYGMSVIIVVVLSLIRIISGEYKKKEALHNKKDIEKMSYSLRNE